MYRLFEFMINAHCRVISSLADFLPYMYFNNHYDNVKVNMLTIYNLNRLISINC